MKNTGNDKIHLDEKCQKAIKFIKRWLLLSILVPIAVFFSLYIMIIPIDSA